MIILVSDTSILIDLKRSGLLEAALSNGPAMCVPDLLYHREFETEDGAYLRNLGLSILALTPEEVSQAQRIRAECKKLSLPDCFALICATRINHALVTDNGSLRQEATARLEQVYGLLWILDRLAESGAATRAQLSEGLLRIAAHPGCRLPNEDVQVRLEAWAPGPICA